MKKLILTSAFGVLFSIAAFAQGSTPTSDGTKMVDQAGYGSGVNIGTVTSDTKLDQTLKQYENLQKSQQQPVQMGTPTPTPSTESPKAKPEDY